MENISCLPEVLMLFRSLNARKHEELKMFPIMHPAPCDYLFFTLFCGTTKKFTNTFTLFKNDD